jgi:recombination protein RecA
VEREKALSTAIQQIERSYGKGAIMKLGEVAAGREVTVIPTGSLPLDLALGVGGMPRGRVVEIYGPESAGKTTVALHVIAEAQKQGGVAAFVDAEHALDPLYAGRIGVNIDELLISQPDTGEQALEIVEVLVFLNQLREKVGIMFGNPETQPGGRALKFYASVRLDIRKVEVIKTGLDSIGARVKVKVVKNKVAPPFRAAEFDILFNEGISREGALIDSAVEFGIIEKSGTWMSYGDMRLGQGRENVRNFLRENPTLAGQMEAQVRAKAAGEATVPLTTGATGRNGAGAREEG